LLELFVLIFKQQEVEIKQKHILNSRVTT